MNKIKSIAVKYGLPVVGFFGLATKAMAQTPAYTMDATVQGAATDLLGSLVQTVFTIIPVAIAIVGGLVVTLFGLRWLIGFARGQMHG
jgi:hypothetical protein